MIGFKEGYDFFAEHASEFFGSVEGDVYIQSVNKEIKNLQDDILSFKGDRTDVAQLKGDLAEFWHSDTFNIDAAIKGSENRTKVLRSNKFGSVDVKGENFEGTYGLKYYENGGISAQQQSKSIFEAFCKYKSKGGKDCLDDYLQKRGYQDDSVINDPVYQGQIRVIPKDQMKDAIQWLEEKIAKEKMTRPDQVKRYEETLTLLRDRISDNKGNESIPLSEEDARKLARYAKEGKINLEEFGISTEDLISYEYILKQACKAGVTAATISIVLKTAPEVINAIKYLIDNGEVDEESFRKIGFAAIKGGAEGFIHGTVSASIISACNAGLLGKTLKSQNPSIIGAVTVLVLDTMQNSYKVATGEMTRNELANELIKTMFTSTCALALGSVAQGFIEIPVLGYMLGSFVGSIAGAFVYSSAYKPIISFCIDTGFTLFGLVDQNYELPDDVMREIGIDVFEYESFEYKEFEADRFEYKRFEINGFEPIGIQMSFLRRGVIGVNAIGYV